MSKEKIIPKCKDGNQSYFSSEGRWLPCCSFPHQGPLLDKSVFSNEEYLIKNNTTFNKFHEKDSFKLWLEFQEENFNSAYSICQKRCSSKSHDIEQSNKNTVWTMEEITFIRNDKQLYDFCEKHDVEFDFEKVLDEK